MSSPAIPSDWQATILEVCVDILDSQRAPVNNKERQARIQDKSPDQLYPYFGATGEVGKIDEYLFDEELVALGEDGVPFLDPRKPKAYTLSGKTWVNNHAHVLRASQSATTNRFLLHYLNQFDYQDFVNGGTRLKLTQANMRRMPFPLPPLAEQKVIADKLDTLLAQVENTKARLERIPQILQRFRQSVLAAAVSGRLTEDWRNEAQVSNIHDLLEKWKSEREQLKSEKRLKQSVGPKTDPSPLIEEVPDSWAWINFEHIADHSNNALKAGPFGSALKKSDCVDAGFKVYGQEQVISGNEKLVTYYVTEQKYEQLNACAVKSGDILISLVGTIGKVLVLSHESEAGIINPRLVKLSLQREVNRRYIELFLESPIAHDFFRGFSHGGTMEILNLSILKELPVALPPTEEQTEIVRRVDLLFAHADRIEHQVNNALARVNNLTQSILAKAFRGELTEQWRRDNPELISGENSAEALLERIQAEHAAAGPVKKTRKRKATA